MSKQNNTVWVSGVKDINTIRGALGVSFGKDDDYPTSATLRFKTHKTEEERKIEDDLAAIWLPILKTANAYKKIDPSLMPDTLYGYKFGKNIKLPPVTLTSCGLVLTEPCAEILQRFRLGETQMS
ncbi:MAG: hypothetical protein Q4B25_09085, partial [Pseudomonadota bacterium]|nr:hypothetical protein [Pseudomonadota bacterium]